MELPKYEYKIEDINFDNIVGISLVDYPAIEENFILLSKDKKHNFNNIKLSKEKNIITGPALIPNKLIYRYNFYNGEHNVFFSEDTVKQISQNFIIDNKYNNVNTNHSTNVNNIKLVESWIVEDPNNDKSKSLGFNELEKGTWMVSYKIMNDNVLDEINNGWLKGFSIEAFITSQFVGNNDIEMEKVEEIYEEIDIILNDDSIDDEDKINKIDDIIKKS